ncbi:MAG: hypothetical protein JOZ70_00375 [Pseudolabrys sp.]|nr:hypothetical protein [Pseudolabrys sp.]
MAPRLTVKSIEFSERPVAFRAPFRFGAVTVNGAAQLFVHAEIEMEGKRSTGASAELMVPKWFNKDPDLSADDTARQLRRSADSARDIYLQKRDPDTAFGLSAACYAAQIAVCSKDKIPPLAAAFGAAEIDKAILDALLRAQGTNFFRGMNDNTAGLDARLTPDLDEAAITAFLRDRAPPADIAVRYTIGMLDSVDDIRSAAQQYRYFKLKLCGDPVKDRVRLIAIAQALGPADYRATADANEQYQSLADLAALVDALQKDEALSHLSCRLLYIEQPFARENTWNFPLGALAARIPFIIDEADDSYDAFPRARALGYRGCSSKSCKGLYKSLLNGARAAQWGREFFITAEDLTCQAGLAVQQDTALVAFHGLGHAERNGHHYVDGFADTPAAEAQAFLAAHPDLYEQAGTKVRLAVREGTISTFSLAAPGFACGVQREAIGRANQTIKELAS